MAEPEPVFGLDPVVLDLPALAGAFSRRLHDAGVPVTAERAARFATALTFVRPIARRRLYWTARAVFVSDAAQVKAFDSVFWSVFGGREERLAEEPEEVRAAPGPPTPRTERQAALRRTDTRDLLVRAAPAAGARERRVGGRSSDAELPAPMAPSDEELLRKKRFDALEPDELAQLYRLMTR